MKITNLTPHTLHLLGGPSETLRATVEPSGKVARVHTRRQHIDDIKTDTGAKIPVFVVEGGNVKNLPASKPNTIYIVSSFVEQTVDRADVFAPGKLVRDDAGSVVGSVGIKKSGV